ncbi:MAG: serine/threonine protein kinase [Prevotella sp.]|nr:serine/threonine protein kinase [Prevotella sp.]
MTFKEGNIIAEHYELKRQLGQGSFGDVWLAHNLLADIDVAIKFYGTLDQKGIEDFRNEFKIAYRLHHPNLLNISHFDVFENCPYLVMPFCENGSVSHRIGQMPESEVWKFILDVSCGLSFLHNQKPPIVHQDIKPDNILITSDGRYVISDFGISRSFRTQMSRTNNKVNSSGTLAYMGPERFSEQPLVVLASDIWAFGMTLYETITGDVLWEGMGGCVQLNGARIPAISGITPELARLVSACLAAETWNRPTAQQIHDYAAAHIQHKQLPPLTYPASEETADSAPVQSLQPVAPVSPTAPIPVVRNEKKPKSNSSFSIDNPSTKRLLMAAAALLGVIVIGAGIIFFHNSINDEQDFISCKTKEDFEQFIKEHPSSSYVSAARKRIEALTPTDKSQTIAPAIQTAGQSPKQSAAPVQPIKEKVKIVEQSAPKQQKKVDDRIYFQPSKTKPASTASRPVSQPNDDAVFYACQTIGDYQSYLNTYPNGRHRSQAQAAINSLLNRNDNTANGAEPVSGDINPRNAAHQNLPPRGYRPSNSSVRLTPDVNRGGMQGRPQRSGSFRSGGSSHRHSN